MTSRLRIEGATKSFGGVHALKGVDLSVEVGEIHALVGENGAGKSTLMKVLSGAIRPDDGTMRIDDDPYAPRSPRDARERGVAMIYQELNLCPHLSVLQNVTLGAERSKLGFTVTDRARKKLDGVLAQLGIETFGPDTVVGTLGPGDRQLVEIARALMSDARIIVFDEPTSSLSRPDVERLFAITRRLAAGQVSVIWISHFLDEIEALGERYTVLRDGRTVATGAMKDTTTDELVSAMIGEAVDESALVRTPGPAGQTTFVVQGLRGERLPKSASFELRRGEVFGIFGLVGSGRTEMLRVLYGLDPKTGGSIRYFGETIGHPSPREWTSRGVGLVSEDRAGEGLALDLSIATNVTLASASSIAGALGTLSESNKARSSEPWTDRLKLRSAGPFQPVRALSGGNQQKVAIARLLHDEVDVLLLDEPTRGIDVGTKAEVVALIDELAMAGNAVLVVTSYLPELMGLCDRIAVMYRGELGPARKRSAWTEDEILDEATRGVTSRDLQ